MQRKLKNVQYHLSRLGISNTDLSVYFKTSASNISHALSGNNKTLLNKIAFYLSDFHNVAGSEFFDYSPDEIRERLDKLEQVQNNIVGVVNRLHNNQSAIIEKLK